MIGSTRFDRDHAALVVIDVQNDFCHQDGLQGKLGRDLSRVDLVVGRIAKLVECARTAKVPVVLAYTTHAPDVDSDEWLARRGVPVIKQNCSRGSWGARLYRLEAKDSDLLIEKHRYSIFSSPGLVSQLKLMGRNSLIFCGYTSNACVETSLRDAVCLDFLATFVEDCCDAYSLDAHRRAVCNVEEDFGFVTTSTEIADFWDKGRTDV